MKDKISANKLGLVLGLFFALLHFLWILLVALGFAKQFMDYGLSMHFMSGVYSISAFNIWTAIALLVFTFVSGYIIGWVFAKIWNNLKI
jgi:hypothetical protein